MSTETFGVNAHIWRENVGIKCLGGTHDISGDAIGISEKSNEKQWDKSL